MIHSAHIIKFNCDDNLQKCFIVFLVSIGDVRPSAGEGGGHEALGAPISFHAEAAEQSLSIVRGAASLPILLC